MRTYVPSVLWVQLPRCGRELHLEAHSQLLGAVSSCEIPEPVLTDKTFFLDENSSGSKKRSAVVKGKLKYFNE